MRRILLVIFLSLFLGTYSWAGITAGTKTSYSIDGKTQAIMVPLTCVTEAGTANFGTYTFNPDTFGVKGWYLYSVEYKPGATGPTNAAWDLDITDATTSYLVSRNLLDNLSSTISNMVYFNTGYPKATRNWTVSIGDNAVNDAAMTIYLVFVPW